MNSQQPDERTTQRATSTQGSMVHRHVQQPDQSVRAQWSDWWVVLECQEETAAVVVASPPVTRTWHCPLPEHLASPEMEACLTDCTYLKLGCTGGSITGMRVNLSIAWATEPFDRFHWHIWSLRKTIWNTLQVYAILLTNEVGCMF